MKDQGRAKTHFSGEIHRDSVLCGQGLPLAAKRSPVLWEGLEGTHQVNERARLGSRGLHALAGASVAIPVEKMAAAEPLCLSFRTTLNESLKFA